MLLLVLLKGGIKVDSDISILSLLSKLIDNEGQIKVLQLISENYFGEELLEKILEFGEE